MPPREKESKPLLAKQETASTEEDYGSLSFLLDSRCISIDEAIERLGYGRFQLFLFWAAGLCMMATSLQVLLLSFLTLVLKSSSSSSDWNLSDDQANFIFSSVFLGATVGSLVLGNWADRYGRKPIFILTAATIAVFGLASGFANNYKVLLFCRFFVGFGFGGLTVPFDTLTEFLPESHRGHNLLAVEFFWTMGTMLVVVLAYFTLGESEVHQEDYWHGWRFFVILCSMPCVVATIWGVLKVPESPRWLLATKNDPEQALKILRDAATINGLDPMELFPSNIVLESDEAEAEGEAGFIELFSPRWFKTTIFLWGTWIGFSFLYYGAVIATTLVFADNTDTDNQQSSYHFNYGALFVSSSAELIGTAAIVWTVDSLGRISIQVFSYLLGGVCVLTMCLLASSEHSDHFFHALVALAFGSRMLMMAGSCTTWVSTAEILTTDIRSTGHSAANAMARIGGFIVPYIVSPSSSLTTIGYSMFSVALLTGFCAWNLPETKGLDLGAATVKKSNYTESRGNCQVV